jgi:SAM-dependent methyltransferase
MDPQQAQTAKIFDSYKDSYSEAVDAAVSFTGLTTDFFTRVKAGYIGDIVQRHFGPQAELAALDIGCGVGNYHPLLKLKFRALVGVDVSSACVGAARKRNAGVDYQIYDGITLPYADGSFDLAFSICVMHHVPPAYWGNFVREMRRVLRPGGVAVVFEHNPRNPFTMRVVNACPFDEDAVLLRNEETERLFREAGFGRVRSSFILSMPAANRFLRRIDCLFSGLRFGGQYYVIATA